MGGGRGRGAQVEGGQKQEGVGEGRGARWGRGCTGGGGQKREGVGEGRRGGAQVEEGQEGSGTHGLPVDGVIASCCSLMPNL